MEIKKALAGLYFQRNALESDLRVAIKVLLDEFNGATGLQVERVDVEISKVQEYSGSRKYYLDKVSVGIDLDEA